MDEITGIPIELASNLSMGGLVALFVVSILLGRLVPRSVLQNGQQLFELRVSEARKEADVWREAYTRSEEARRVLANQAQTSVSTAETLSRLLERVAPEALPRGDHP